MSKLACTFQTRHGQVALTGLDLWEIKLAHEEHGVHRVRFSNQSVLAGVLGPEQISLPIKYDPRIRLDIPRDMILSIRFPGEPKDTENLACLSLNNEDKLYGQIKDTGYELDTEFGPVTVKPSNVVAMNFDPNQPSWVAVKFWNGTTLRGRMKQQSLKFKIQPGPELDVNIGLIASLDCPDALPPEETIAQVKKLVGLLEAANFKDRQEAQEALERMGPTILPLLKKSITDKDPEVRQRLTAIIEKLGGAVPQTPAAENAEGGDGG